MKQNYLSLKNIKDTFVLQHDQSDCGVACLSSIIHLYGGSQQLEKLRSFSGTTKQGTTMLGLFQAANEVGFKAQGCKADLKALRDYERPVILHVLIEEKLQHFIVCYGFHKNKGFYIGDPGKGFYYLSKTELNKIWVSKSCLTLEPNDKFITEKSASQSRVEKFLGLIKKDYKLLTLSILLGSLVSFLGMAMAVFSQKLIDEILPSGDFKKLITGIILLTFLLLVRVGFTTVRQYFLLVQSKDFSNRINNEFYSSLLYIRKPFFDHRTIGDLVARLNDTQRVQKVIGLLAGNVIIDGLVSIFSLGILFFYSWKIGIIASVSLPIFFMIIYRKNNHIIKSQKEIMQAYAMNESNYIGSIQGIATIKNNNKQKTFAQRNTHIYGNLQEKIFSLGRLNMSLSFYSGVASVIFIIGILFYASVSVYNNKLLMGELMAILGISGSLLPSVANLALISIPINEAKVAFKRIYEISSVEKEKEEGYHIKNLDIIEIRNLSFRFPGRRPILSNVNILIEKGKLTAVVGESGSGKSTIAQVLQRFYSIENGSILVNNHFELTDLNLKSYRKLIGVVPQDITIFNGTVKDNILLGKKHPYGEILSFLNKFNLLKFFEHLPQGLDTIIGEEGINLSGGQKQMIGFARALYKQPQFLVLDEPTAAMDQETERFIMDLLVGIKHNCAILFISHRLQTLRSYADHIYVLQNNTVEISGSHNELLQSVNFYSNFWMNPV